MQNNTKIIIGVGVAVLALLLLSSKKSKAQTVEPSSEPKNSEPNNSNLIEECRKAFDEAVHPDVVRTPEEQKMYQSNWIQDCLYNNFRASTDV